MIHAQNAEQVGVAQDALNATVKVKQVVARPVPLWVDLAFGRFDEEREDRVLDHERDEELEDQ